MLDSGQKSFELFLPLRIPEGTFRWVKLVGFFTDEYQDGKRLAYTTMIDVTDITELRELKRKLEERTEMLNNALEEAKRANAAKSDFLSRMSHDIRTPMNVIAGMTEIADSHLNEPERVKDSLRKIRLSCRHLLGLVNDVPDMSKIENGNFPINAAPVSLPEVLGDALRLRQILLNLLSNASKFTPEGGKISFTIEQLPQAQQDMVMVLFTVSDNGRGIRPEFLEYIFDAFTREQDSRTDRTEGSGLGMAITKRLVDLMGGAITVRSKPGEGSTFEVDLPMKRGETEPVERIASGMRVLLADGDPAARTYGACALKELGAEVECADSGVEAADKVYAARQSGKNYHMVILDEDMPGMADYAAVRRIPGKGERTGRGV